MSKKEKDSKKKDKKGNEKKSKINTPENVKILAKVTLKKFKKENDYFDSKKELKKAYYDYLIELLPDAIKFVIRYGHMEDNKETKDAIYEKICDESFVKHLTKKLKKDDVEGIELLPNVIYDILKEAAKHTTSETSDNKDNKDAKETDKKDETKAEEFDLTDLTELSKLILKKKLKKLTKEGIDDATAFDILSVIPSSKIMDKSPYHHIRNLFMVLYQHAKTKTIPFNVIMKKVFDDDNIKHIISFAMLERKSKLSNMTDKQKTLYNDITKYCFNKLEKYEKDDITDIIKTYIKCRKNDEQRGNDDTRRFYLSALPAETYPKINKIVSKMIKADENLKKYF